MPAYNAEKTIYKSVHSIINQDFKDWVLYIINDCSKDNTLEVISKFNDERIILKSNSNNMGVAYSRNVGLEEAQCGDRVFFIDSDDVWESTKLRLQIDALNKHNIVCTDYFYVGNSKNEVKSHLEKISAMNFLKKKFRVCFSSLGYNVNDQNLNLRFKNTGHEDFVFINSLLNFKEKIYCLPITLVEMYKIEGSLSSNKKKAIKWHYNNLKEIFPNNSLKVGIYMFFYIFNGFVFSRKNR